MIDNLNDLADKALAFRPENSVEVRLLMAEAKVAELEAYNEFLETKIVDLKNYVEKAQEVFEALDLEGAKGCVFSEEELGVIKENIDYQLFNWRLNQSECDIRNLIISKIDAYKKKMQPSEDDIKDQISLIQSDILKKNLQPPC